MKKQKQQTIIDVAPLYRKVMPEGDVSFDLNEWVQLKLDTPIAPPPSRIGRLELDPGTCVKTILTGNVFPWCGIVQQNTPDACVVIGHGDFQNEENTFVWKGNYGEFKRVWRID